MLAETDLTGSNLDIGHLKMNISKLKNNNIYESLTFSHTIPTAENKWVEYYPFLENFDWSIVYSLPSKKSQITQSSIQYNTVKGMQGVITI